MRIPGDRRVTRLEEIKNGATVAGIVPHQIVEAISVEWIGNQSINLVCRISGGNVSETTLYRDDEHRLVEIMCGSSSLAYRQLG